jgi:hypothetical protein
VNDEENNSSLSESVLGRIVVPTRELLGSIEKRGSCEERHCWVEVPMHSTPTI